MDPFRRRNILVDLLILVLVLLSSRIHWHARPHAFSLLLIVLLYQILILHQEDRGNYLYVIPPMMLLWVNLHGGFIVGFLFMGIFLSGYFLGYSCFEWRGEVRIRKQGKAVVPGLRRLCSCGVRESFRCSCVSFPLPRGVGNLPDGPCAGIPVPRTSMDLLPTDTSSSS